MEEKSPGSGARALLVAAALFALALGLRLVGLDYMLPHAPEPDLYLAYQAEAIHADDGSLEGHPIWGKYPHLLPRWVVLTAGGPGEAPPVDEPDGEDLEPWRATHLEQASHWARASRLWSAVFSSLAIPLTFLLARRRMGDSGGVLAALFLCSSLLHLCLSQQGRPHGPLGSALLLSVLAGLWVVDRSQVAGTGERRWPWGAWSVMTLAVFLSVGTLHNGLAAGPLVVATWWIAGGKRRLRYLVSWVLPAAATVAALLVFYPFLWNGTGGEAAELGEEGVVQAGHEIRLSWFSGGGFADLAQTFTDYDPWLGIWSGIGLLMGLAALAGAQAKGARRTDLIVVLSFCVPYLLVVGLFERSYPRFATPLLPFAAWLAAYAVQSLGRRPVRIALLGALLLVPPFVQVGRKLQLNLRPDTFELFAERFGGEGLVERKTMLVDPAFVPPVMGRVTDSSDETTLAHREDLMYLVPWAEYLRSRSAVLPEDWIEFREAPGRMSVDRSVIRSRDPLVRADRMADEVARLLKQERSRWYIKGAPFRTDIGGITQTASRRAGFEAHWQISPWKSKERTAGARNGYEKERLWRTLWERERWGAGIELGRRGPATPADSLPE